MTIQHSFNQALKDRPFVLSWLLLFALFIILALSVGVRIHPSELNVITRYTAFGPTFFYKDAWYYLLLFIVFGGVVIILHTLVALKLLAEKNISFARLFLFISIAIMVIALFLTNNLLGVATLS